ncbi:hypothetical protein L198_05409 [Cryptococcus wingfieldii CBS 7118]|uniref:Glutamate--cysteine ligase n=1 Tax=Cryptococcus wingfieldii CBS 7118 TaxID=1295528 RepID=A0A1E3IY61_9TREE|nr:hypothetical protein L198_05409 [Cryptococcus wingfieldii CBS 7118]ODN93544.1 hypothetical protein L198_05409 [Cryptococcus wingfieldii CBS 7118]
MGLLVQGSPLSWEETKPLAEHIRDHGLTQFLNIWDKTKGRTCINFLWGDEIEYMVASLDHERKSARLSLRQSSVTIKALQADGIDSSLAMDQGAGIPTFHHEYGRYQIESTPGNPFSDAPSSLLSVEGDMRFRRQIIRRELQPSEILLTITSWPRMGVTDTAFTTEEPMETKNQEDEDLEEQHVDVDKLTRGRSVRYSDTAVYRQAYRHEAAGAPPRRLSSEGKVYLASSGIPTIFMDAMAYGIGCCCLQVTLQASDVDEARTLFDGLVSVAPIMLALTAASPVFHGRLSDLDTRWDAIVSSTDDRTEDEKKDAKVRCRLWHCSKLPRWHSVNMYIANDDKNKPEYGIEVPTNAQARKRLLEHGIDNKMADHIAHLFIRDPLIQMSELVNQDDSKSTLHFDGINTGTWPSVRFKPPPPDSTIGWRVEIRTMEIQMTDFENAAFSIFVVLLTRAITSLKLNFYIPISKVDENMERAHQRNAAATKTFVFRKNIFPFENSSDSEAKDDIQDMSLNDIINGDGAGFPGLMGVVEKYLKTVDADEKTMDGLGRYLDFIKLRAKGDLMTPASWIRNFITSHPDYKQDSIVSDEINYDLVKAIDELERGQRSVPELLGKDFYARSGPL